MELKEAITKALKSDKHTRTDPFLLHARVCDLIGNDYDAKKAAEELYRLNAKYQISKAVLTAAPRRRKKKAKRYFLKPVAPPPAHTRVFYTDTSPTLHLSKQCPCLKGWHVRRTLYRNAQERKCRQLYFPPIRLGRGTLRLLSYTSPPPLCRRCGGLKPIRASILERLCAFLERVFDL